MKKNKIYCCYSVPLMKYLTEQKGFQYEIVGLNPNSYNTFWAFIKTKELDEELRKWKK